MSAGAGTGTGTDADAAPILAVLDLIPRWGADVRLSFTLRAGEAACLRGPSGAGKSTVLAQLALMDPPAAGTLRLAGRDPADWDEARRSAARRRWIGWSPQDGLLVDGLSLADNVALPGLLAGRPPPAAALTQALAALDLAPLAQRRTNQLSYGERIRAGVARLLLQRPPVALFDEPTAGQDAARAERVGAALAQLQRGGCAVVVATHDAALAARTGSSHWLTGREAR